MKIIKKQIPQKAFCDRFSQEAFPLEKVCKEKRARVFSLFVNARSIGNVRDLFGFVTF